jgi:hypothetical protein
MPFSSLLASRSKTDYAKQLKDFFTVIENEQDKEKKHYEDVSFGFKTNICFAILSRLLKIFTKHYLH